jgi:homoserine O-acetyltransferase
MDRMIRRRVAAGKGVQACGRAVARACLTVLGLTAAARAEAQGPLAVPVDTGTFVLRDFRFASGEVLPEVRMHYRTLGRLRRGPGGVARNAVLILHGTGGSGGTFLRDIFAGELFGRGQALDTATTFIIIPDNLGHGRSSKPSDGLRARFPQYAYEDMVTAQYRLLTEGLRVDHLLLVMGTSMGCMHSWLWAERWPGFMDAAFPLACIPTQIAGRNRMWRRLLMDAIRLDPGWNGGDYTAQPYGLRAALELIWIAGTAPLNEQRLAPTRDSADAFITRWMEQRLAATDANDLLYAVGASRDYDPSCCLERITAPVLAINTADDVINPPELGLMERLMPRVRNGRFILIPTSDATRGHGSHTVAALWKHHLAGFLAPIRAERQE